MNMIIASSATSEQVMLSMLVCPYL